MMLLYAPIKLKCTELIQFVTSEYMAQFNTKYLYTKTISFSDEQLDIINSEMEKLGLPKIYSKPLSFKRRLAAHINRYGYQWCHLDGPYHGLPIKSSLVVPVSGCEDTEQYWYDGDYVLTTRITDNNIKYYNVNWNSPPKLIGKVEILDGPMLCRTDIPHSAYGNGREYRTTCTLRFVGNPSFEEILERFNSAK